MSDQYQRKAKIIRSERLTHDIMRLTLLAPEIARAASPGQFVMLRVSDAGFDPLLRRPFSIYHTTADGQVQLMYKVVGKGTRILAGMGPGGHLDLVGPLGQGFTFGEEASCLIGGGMGAAPLFFLAASLLRLGNVPLIFLGARNREELGAIVPAFLELGVKVATATDDGSAGHHGYVVDLLVTEQDEAPRTIYSCGPYPMLRAVSQLCHLRSLKCQVSLETMMACGISACLGCAIPGVSLNGYLHVCKDGPVFSATQVAWF
jgi:dihydroorotate dehydrogenase electron transfer subunit